MMVAAAAGLIEMTVILTTIIRILVQSVAQTLAAARGHKGKGECLKIV